MDTTQVIDLLSTLSQQLGVASEYVFSVLVKKQVIQGVIDFVVTTAALFVLWKIYSFSSKKHEETDYDSYAVAHVLSGIALLIFTLMAIFIYSACIGQILNPEAYAIKEILDTFKAVK